MNTNIIVVVVYIDNTFFSRQDKTLLDKIKAKFMSIWEYRDLGDLSKFPQIKIACHNQQIYINQTDYLKKVLLCFQI